RGGPRGPHPRRRQRRLLAGRRPDAAPRARAARHRAGGAAGGAGPRRLARAPAGDRPPARGGRERLLSRRRPRARRRAARRLPRHQAGQDRRHRRRPADRRHRGGRRRGVHPLHAVRHAGRRRRGHAPGVRGGERRSRPRSAPLAGRGAGSARADRPAGRAGARRGRPAGPRGHLGGRRVSRRRRLMTRGRRLLLVLSLVAALTAATAAQPRGGTLRVAVPTTPTGYVVTQAGGLADVVAEKLIQNGLTRYDEKTLQPVPALATEWKAESEARVWTFRLRSGVRWHDGRPFTAEDVKFTFDTLMNEDVRARMRGNRGPLEKVEVVDPATVRFTFREPFAPFPVMVGYNAGILPKHL